MKIVSAKYIQPEPVDGYSDNTLIDLTMEDGSIATAPADSDVGGDDSVVAWLAQGGVISPYQPPVPSTNPVDYPLKRWEFKAMVDVLGKKDAIPFAINQIPDKYVRAKALARYEESDTYNYEDPLFAQLAPAIGLTMKQVADAWMQIVGDRQ